MPLLAAEKEMYTASSAAKTVNTTKKMNGRDQSAPREEASAAASFDSLSASVLDLGLTALGDVALRKLHILLIMKYVAGTK